MTEYSKVLLGYQLGHVVEWWKNQQPEDKDRNGLWNIGFFTIQPLDLADSLREPYYEII
jgi:hypothetical protein